MIMKPETRSENDWTPLATTFGMKQRTRIGCWNVRTMTRPEALPQVAKVMRDYNIQILGLSETRWNGFGEQFADCGTTLLYSGKEDEGASKEYGVGLLLSRSAKNSLLDWKPVSERIIVARFASRVRKVTVIQCYAPTSAASDEAKSKFYDVLEATLKCVRKQDIVVLMDDMNAKMGSNCADCTHYVGPFGAIGQKKRKRRTLR